MAHHQIELNLSLQHQKSYKSIMPMPSIEDIIWKNYKEQSERLVKYDTAIFLPDETRIHVYGTILAVRAQSLHDLIGSESNTVDLTSSQLSSDAIRAVLDHIHGAFDSASPRLALPKVNFPTLHAMLIAADYCGAEACKEWIGEIFIDKQINTLQVKDLHTLAETAHAIHAQRLFEAAGVQLARRAPTDVLASTSSDILAAVIDCTVTDRAGRMLVGDVTGAVSLYDIGTGKLQQQLEVLHRDSVLALAYYPETSFLASASWDHTIVLWDMSCGSCMHILSHNDAVNGVAFFSKNEQILLASASQDQTCKIWDTRTGTCLHTLQHTSCVLSVCFECLQRFQVLASGCIDSTIKIWSSASWSEIHTLRAHTQDVVTLAFSPKICPTALLASGSFDNTVRLWSQVTWECVHTLTGHEDYVRDVAWSPDGSLVVSGSADGSCRLWNPVKGECMREFSAIHTSSIRSVKFSPDGRLVISSSEDLSISFCDALIGKIVRRVQHYNPLTSMITFRP